MTQFKLPDIGEGIVECEVVEWHVQEGDSVAEDQPVVEVMTDKALVEITAPETGNITRLHVAKGETARVHEPLFAYDAENAASGESTDSDKSDESVESAESSESGKSGDTAEDDRAEPADDAEDAQGVGSAPADTASRTAPPRSEPTDAPPARGSGAYGRIPASPAVRRLLRENELRLEQVPGSGKDGRVLKEDVLSFLDGAADTQPASSAPACAGQATSRVEPLRGVRAAMARQMVESASTIPHFQYGEEIDVTRLLALHERLKPEAEAQETRLTLMPLFMKALALAVQAYPILNSRLDMEAGEIHYQAHCNIGMAVDGKAGLMVPNVKQVETLSLLEVATEVQRLTTAAREGRVSRADLQEGTISVSNIGALGGTYAAPIINAPEVAIVAIGKTQWLPRFDANGEVVSRAIMTATWAGDHRLIDGGTIARFCNVWKGYLEDPETMLLSLR